MWPIVGFFEKKNVYIYIYIYVCVCVCVCDDSSRIKYIDV